MPDDIVTRLRQWSHHEDVHCASAAPCPTLTEAADEIERLRAENARLSLDLMTALGELMEARRAR